MVSAEVVQRLREVSADNFVLTVGDFLHGLDQLNEGHESEQTEDRWGRHLDTKIHFVFQNVELDAVFWNTEEWNQARRAIEKLYKGREVVPGPKALEKIKKLDEHFRFIPDEDDFFKELDRQQIQK